MNLSDLSLKTFASLHVSNFCSDVSILNLSLSNEIFLSILKEM